MHENWVDEPTTSLVIERVGYAAAAEVRGVDLGAALCPAAFARLRAAMAEHLVLIFPEQNLEVGAMVSFAERWGPLFLHPNLTASELHPGLIAVERRPGDERHTGSEWHTDTTHMRAPPKFTMMHAKVVPKLGGDTMFANQYLAYEALSAGMKKMLDGLRAVHSDIRVAGPGAALNAKRTNKTREDRAWRPTCNLHPVVKTHPDTGRKALYVNIAATIRFEGMTEEESRPLLHYLCTHATQLQFTYRHRWERDSLVMWDNRALLHIALDDCPDEHRLMHRLQVAGEAADQMPAPGLRPIGNAL